MPLLSVRSHLVLAAAKHQEAARSGGKKRSSTRRSVRGQVARQAAVEEKTSSDESFI